MWASGGPGQGGPEQGGPGQGDCERGAPEWKVVLRAANYALAGMIKELLQGEGFLVMLRSESGLPHSAFGGPLDVLVPSDQVEAAKALVDAFAETSPAEPPPGGGER